MQAENTTDTIAAIATPPGVGGIGVIRVSGPEAFAAVLPGLRLAADRGAGGAAPPSHQLTFARVIEPDTLAVVDEVLVAFMQAPHTYTRENVVEIQGHGGPLVLRRILRLVLAQGVRMANPGEFTLRAFLNGRLDLAQAEAVMDLIGAQTEAGQRLAVQQLSGRVSAQVQEARHAVLGVIARIEASIDFPEEDVPTPQEEELRPLIVEAQRQVAVLLAGSEQGRSIPAGAAYRDYRTPQRRQVEPAQCAFTRRPRHRHPHRRYDARYRGGGREPARHSPAFD